MDMRRVILIGNSYTFFHQMPVILEALLQVGDPDGTYTVDAVIEGGVNLEWHLEQRKAEQLVRAHPGAMVVLQERGWGAIEEPEKMSRALARWSGIIRESGSEAFLYMTPVHDQHRDSGENLFETFRTFCEKYRLNPLPVGPAYDVAEGHIGKSLLLREIDGYHPGVLGAALTALVMAYGLTLQAGWPFDAANAVRHLGDRLGFHPEGHSLAEGFDFAAREALNESSYNRASRTPAGN